MVDGHRKIIRIITEGFEGLDIVGVDVVEVLPRYDNSEVTGTAAAEFTIEVSFPQALGLARLLIRVS